MNVTLKIENDAELRAYIKECIKGQVLSIARDEFMETIKTEIQRKILGSVHNFEEMKIRAFLSAAKDILLKAQGIHEYDHRFIYEAMTKVIQERIDSAIKDKDWNVMVDNLAIQKITQLMSK